MILTVRRRSTVLPGVRGRALIGRVLRSPDGLEWQVADADERSVLLERKGALQFTLREILVAVAVSAAGAGSLYLIARYFA